MIIVNRYLAIQVLIGLLIATATLVPLFIFFDLQDQLDDVGTGTYQARDAFMYTALLLPRRFIQLVPFIVLLGNVVALGRLAISLELTSLRAAGLSPLAINRAPLMVGIAVLVSVSLMDEFLAPQMQQKALDYRNSALGLSVELGENLGTWTRDERQILRIGQIDYGTRARDVDIFQFDDNNIMSRHIHADYADIIANDLWVLTEVLERQFNTDGEVLTTRSDSMSWESFLRPREISTLTKPPESLSPSELFQYVTYLNNTGQESRAYSLALWRRAGGIFTTLAMILLSLPFVFGSVRQGLGNKLVLAALTGLSAYLFDQIIANVGLLLNLNTVVTALLPGMVLLALGIFLFRRIV
jgi:lipopolysaccharide export system permease protein